MDFYEVDFNAYAAIDSGSRAVPIPEAVLFTVTEREFVLFIDDDVRLLRRSCGERLTGERSSKRSSPSPTKAKG